MSRLAAYYAQEAPDLAARYETVSFERVHAPLLPFLPLPGARVADIGAGAGRDARALVALGYEVLAVEPSPEMRGQSHEPQVAGLRWCDDRLPQLARVHALNLQFDFILCSAVLMHLRAPALPLAFRTMSSLLTSDGRIAVSLRRSRPGDPLGLYFDHPAKLLLDSATAAGLSLLAQGSSADALARTDVKWSWFVFATPPSQD